MWVTGDWTGWAATVEGGAVELTNDGSGMWSVTTLIEDPSEVGGHEP